MFVTIILRSPVRFTEKRSADPFKYRGISGRTLCWVLTVALAGGALGPLQAQTAQGPVRAGGGNASAEDRVILPPATPDPLEPFNRAMWGVNKGVMTAVISPTSRLYRFVVVKPVRTSINNFGRNITYPGRLANNLLQGKWAGARYETDRFFCNTIVGLGGFFDVASKWNIPKSNADFGQSFGRWGWDPHFYLMLPVLGPSNDRDAVGSAADTLASPIIYFPPYSYSTYGISYNKLGDSVVDYQRFSESESDPYSVLHYAWTFVRENQVVDFQVKGEQDPPSLETLQSVFFTFKDQEFPSRGKTRSVRIPSTGQKLKFTYWLQPGTSSVVYILPGLGSHRMTGTALALAEMVYNSGFSAVCVSSAFNAEFMEQASTAALPAYTPVDGHDVHVALTEVDHRLEQLHPHRLAARTLMGYSMGGFHSLYIAASSLTNQDSLLTFDRFVAINPPVHLITAMDKLDEFYQAPMEWPSAERTENIKNTFLKVAALSKRSLSPDITLPFSAVESKFLIGTTFRFILRDMIFTSQRQYNMNVLSQPISNWRREPVYQEILQYSYKDYFNQFVVPYYRARDIDLTDPQTRDQAGNLRAYTEGLQKNHDIRLILNQNDFLLSQDDLDWFGKTFAPEQINLFQRGGHLGNLAHPNVQKAILRAIEDLRTPGAIIRKPRETKPTTPPPGAEGTGLLLKP